MVSISAVIHVKKGAEREMRNALLAVATHAMHNEPETIGFFISQDDGNPCRFTTYERFTDQDAMDRHNGSDVVARFSTWPGLFSKVRSFS